MRHVATDRFWTEYRKLPKHVQRAATKTYRNLVRDPRHPALQLKKVGTLWSVRATLGYRALAVETDSVFVWVWIGPHSEYERLIRR